MESTLNEAAGSSPEAPFASPGGELISTVEYRGKEPEATSPASADTKGATDDKKSQDSSSGDQSTGEDGDKDHTLDRFDRHPRFIQLNKQNAEMKAMLADMKQRLDSQEPRDDKGTKGKADKPASFDDLDDTSIFEKLNNDPKKFLGDFAAKIKSDAIAEFTEATRAEASRNQAVSDFANYAKDNPDTNDGKGFDQMWDSGEIKSFIADHPGHNAISAHMAMTADRKIQEATSKAVAEATEKLQKQFQAKRNAAVIGGGPASTVVMGGKGNADLANTKTQGGLTSTLAARLERMRASA